MRIFQKINEKKKKSEEEIKKKPPQINVYCLLGIAEMLMFYQGIEVKEDYE